MLIRNAAALDYPAVLALNLAFERFLSPMNAARLTLLDSQAQYHRVIEIDGEVAAFLLAFREGTAYDSSNYHWFSQYFAGDPFVYIDRVVIAASQQGRGLGKLLYQDLFTFAQQSGVQHVACEYDADPPNPGSERFHAAMGFASVGTHTVAYANKPSGKQVSMQVASLANRA